MKKRILRIEKTENECNLVLITDTRDIIINTEKTMIKIMQEYNLMKERFAGKIECILV